MRAPTTALDRRVSKVDSEGIPGDASGWLLRWEMTGRIGLAVVFFISVLVFVAVRVEPRLIYHGDMMVLGPEWQVSFPVFLTGSAFFREHVEVAGGVGKYLAALSYQCYHNDWAGAGVVTLIGVLLFAAALMVGRLLKISHPWMAAYVPPLVLLGAIGAYTFPLEIAVNLLLAMAAVAVYRLVGAGRHGGWSLVVALALVATVYWCAMGAVWLLAAICVLMEGLRWGRWRLACSLALLSVGVIFLGTYFSWARLPEAGLRLSWWESTRALGTTSIPAGVFLTLMAGMLVWTWWRAKASRVPGDEVGDVRHRHVRSDQVPRGACATALLAGVTLLVMFGMLDKEAQALLRVNYWARTHQWGELLTEIRANPPSAYPPCLLYDLNRALYETGQLLDQMFAFPQDLRFWVQYGEDAVPYLGCHEMLLRLGCINEAEHTVYEALEVMGPRPVLLRQLALIHLAKDQSGAARVILNVLERDIVHRPWARDLLTVLDQEADVSSQSAVAGLRRRMVQEDRVAVLAHQLVDLVLEQDPGNRMAFEYAVAQHLLTGQTDRVVECIGEFRARGYRQIPDHCAEAVLLHWQLTGAELDLHGYAIDPAIVNRFTTFVQLTQQRQSMNDEVQRIAAGTYYEYYFARQTMMP